MLKWLCLWQWWLWWDCKKWDTLVFDGDGKIMLVTLLAVKILNWKNSFGSDGLWWEALLKDAKIHSSFHNMWTMWTRIPKQFYPQNWIMDSFVHGWYGPPLWVVLFFLLKIHQILWIALDQWYSISLIFRKCTNSLGKYPTFPNRTAKNFLIQYVSPNSKLPQFLIGITSGNEFWFLCEFLMTLMWKKCTHLVNSLRTALVELKVSRLA